MYVRRRSPLGVIVGLIVLGIGAAAVIPQINDRLKASGRDDAQARRLSELADGKLGSSYFITANFRRELSAVRRRLGPRAPMLEVDVARAGLEFQYVVGQRAAGFTVNTIQPGLKPEEVTLDEPGSPRKRAFSLALVRAGVPAALVRVIRRRPAFSDFTPDGISLARSDVDGRVEWSVTGAGGGHELVFTARPDGSRMIRRS
jgi:hypothetical protein